MRAASRIRALHLGVTAVSTVLAGLGVALVGEAVTTRTIELDEASEFTDGELQETTVSSLGEVRIGLETRKVPLTDVAAVWSLARPAPDLPGPAELGGLSAAARRGLPRLATAPGRPTLARTSPPSEASEYRRPRSSGGEPFPPRGSASPPAIDQSAGPRGTNPGRALRMP